MKTANMTDGATSIKTKYVMKGKELLHSTEKPISKELESFKRKICMGAQQILL